MKSQVIITSVLLSISAMFPSHLLGKTAYQCVDKDGSLMFTDSPCQSVEAHPMERIQLPDTRELASIAKNTTKRSEHAEKQRALTCLKHQHKLAHVERQLREALKPAARDKLNVDAEWLARQMELTCQN